MEKILLGVTGVRTEMRRGKMQQPFGADAAAWEIKFAQRAFDPDIHRKRAIEAIGEQQHAVGNFVPDAAQVINSSRASASGKWRRRSRSNLPSAICRAAASRCGARNPILQARSSASVAPASRCGVGKE